VLRITNAALGETLADPNGRTVVKITKQKGFLDISDSDEEETEGDGAGLEEFVLCALTPGKVCFRQSLAKEHGMTRELDRTGYLERRVQL
jgi:hypothetical protein